MTGYWLSRIRLRREVSAAALAPILLPADPHARAGATHRLLWTLFADDRDRQRDFLWRENSRGGLRPGRASFLVLSARPPADRHDLFDVESKPFEPALAPGDRLGFSLRANPVVTRPNPESGRPKRHDVVMDRLHGLPKGARADARLMATLEAGRVWLAGEGAGSGFQLPLNAAGEAVLSVDGYDQVRVPRGRGQKAITFSVLDLGGVLEVVSPRLRQGQGVRLWADADPARLTMAGALPGLPPPRPIPIKDRSSIVFVEKGQIDVLDGAFVVIDVNGARTHIPVGGFACLMLEPGTRVSHAAVALAARAGTLLVWIGEAGVRLYASGQPGGARAYRLLWQARLALDETARLKVVRKSFELRFGEPAPGRRSVDQLRGIEGVRVRTLYEHLARQHGITWNRRAYDGQDWQASDIPNRCLSAATSCLYGIAEAAVLASGYAPAVGFLHSGKPLSFVYDIGDIFKFETVVPASFKVAAQATKGRLDLPLESAVRRACRDLFRRTSMLERVIPTVEEVLLAGELVRPEAPADAQPVAFEDQEPSGDAGHRG